MTGARAMALAIAAVAALWALYNVSTLIGDGVFFMPGNRIGGVGHWQATSETTTLVIAFVMAIYCAAPLFFLALARRQAR
ncbi:hypothetical protein [Chenggangzhangella methanolivorans]|uniref:Uncharacterized protein n=1 Tax=Chenggangzhangella methanolivorans TaxID=1437009 RepID=A0A9E6RBZ3_9HYPH|nr:hypothetical protein [Chenggangzhangella methanolivorans]QZO01540.1 hypothetical protein K6K41_08995 [Chenggangzhangella methanolivorans]